MRMHVNEEIPEDEYRYDCYVDSRMQQMQKNMDSIFGHIEHHQDWMRILGFALDNELSEAYSLAEFYHLDDKEEAFLSHNEKRFLEVIDNELNKLPDIDVY